MSGNIKTNIEFHAKVLKVEERFKNCLTDEARAKAGGTNSREGQIETTQVSDGWWVSLDGWGAAMRFGDMKPHCDPGDIIVFETRIIKAPKESA